MEITYHSLSGINKAAKEIIEAAGDKKCWLFYGDMGAGKTTLIKALGNEFNIVDEVTSPTFSLVNEYLSAKNETYYHFDFYRIKSEEEAFDIGAEEYFYSGNLCWIEWPEKIPGLIPDEYLEININLVSVNARKITLTHHDRPS